MTKKERAITNLKQMCSDGRYLGSGSYVPLEVLEDFNLAIKALELEPCCNCIEFKRYAKQMGFSIEKESIPYLMHKEMDIPISECQKAYDIALEYLRSQAKVRG